MSRNDRGLNQALRKVQRVRGVHTTAYKDVAMARGYIGMSMIRPKPVSFYIHFFVTGIKMRAAPLYYYGTPDEATAARFGL